MQQPDIDSLRERLEKVEALADRGATSGERECARHMAKILRERINQLEKATGHSNIGDGKDHSNKEKAVVYTHVRGVDKIVPMGASDSDVEIRAYRWLASGNYTPDDMLIYSNVLSITRMYVPTFVFHGRYSVAWSASFGYNRTVQKPYVVTGAHGHKETKYRNEIETDWRPASGTDGGSFTIICYAGTYALPPGVISLVEDSNYKNSVVVYDPVHTPDNIELLEEVYQRDEVFSSRGSGRLNSIILSNVKKHAKGDQQKDWHVSDRQITRLDAEVMYFPIGHIILEYKGSEFNLWEDGSDVSRAVGDKLPEESSRKKAVYIGFIPVIVSCVACLLSVNASGASSYPVLGAAMTLTVLYGAIRRYTIIRRSKLIRLTLLNIRIKSVGDGEGMPEDGRRAYDEIKDSAPQSKFFEIIVKDRPVLPIVAMLSVIIAFSGQIMTQAANVFTGVQQYVAEFGDRKADDRAGQLSERVNTQPAATPEPPPSVVSIIPPSEEPKAPEVDAKATTEAMPVHEPPQAPPMEPSVTPKPNEVPPLEEIKSPPQIQPQGVATVDPSRPDSGAVDQVDPRQSIQGTQQSNTRKPFALDYYDDEEYAFKMNTVAITGSLTLSPSGVHINTIHDRFGTECEFRAGASELRRAGTTISYDNGNCHVYITLKQNRAEVIRLGSSKCFCEESVTMNGVYIRQ